MRYLIIDTEGTPASGSTVFGEHGYCYGQVMSAEESLLMFKDIWFRAQANSDENIGVLYDGLSENERETMSWDEFKETL